MKFVYRLVRTLLIFGLFLSGTAFAAEFSNGNELLATDNSSGTYEEKLRVDFISHSTIPEFDSDILQNMKTEDSTRGLIPEIKTNEGRQNWLIKLDEIRVGVRNDMLSYLYPKGPVVSYGWEMGGYFKVVFAENVTVDGVTRDEIYAVISDEGKKLGLDNTLLVFLTDEKLSVDMKVTPINYDKMFRPVIGGVQQQIFKSGGYYPSTVGFAAKEDDGTLGYVTAKHAANQTGLHVYQPVHDYEIGTVSIVSVGTNADASFIERTGVSSDIHRGSSVYQCVERAENPYLGLIL